MHETALSFCRQTPVIPVLQIEDAATAVPIAEALLAGGLSVLEITFRTAAAAAAITEVVRALPQAIVAAGSVRTVQQLQTAKEAGAHFAVCPGASDTLLHADILPLLPGGATASELMKLDENQFSFIKFFPAAAAGGVSALKAFYGPFSHLQFCPTGGITAQSAADYLALPNVVCVGGSWLVNVGDSTDDIYKKATLAAQLCPTNK